MGELYRGYILTSGKKARQAFKNVRDKDLLKLSDAKKNKEYAGVLGYNTILIDVDDERQSDILYKIIQEQKIRCKVYKTFRGKHFVMYNSYVTKCFTHCNLCCGVSCVDIKVGNSYQVLKLNRQEREVLLDFDDYDTIPGWMFPIKTRLNFEGMGSGSGRNDILFKYVTELKNEGLSKENIIKCIEMTNDYQFEVPLPTSELYNTVLRNDYLDAKENKKGSLDLYEFAKKIKEEFHVKRINGDIFVYVDGVYINNTAEIERKMVSLRPDLKRNTRMEVLAYIDLITTEEARSDPMYVAFSNGIYSIEQDKLLDFSPEYNCINKIEHRYNPYAECKVVAKAFRDFACGDLEIVNLLEEMIGYCLYRRNELRKAFILVGEKQSGKSTFLEMLQHLIGLKNCAFLDLKELGHQFKPAELSGKLVNIGDDIEDGYIAETAVFKKVVTGNPVTVERKNQNPFALLNYSKFIFSANSVPRIKDVGGGVYSRLVLVPFKNNFENTMEHFDLEIIDKLTTEEAMETLIVLGIGGLKRLLKNRKFSIPNESDKLMYEYKIDNDSVNGFIDENPRDSLVNKDTGEVYTKYCVFCADNGLKPKSKVAFSKTICSRYGMIVLRKTIAGKQVRYYDTCN